MKVSDLVASRRLTRMSPDELLERIRSLRAKRMSLIPNETKPKRRRAEPMRTPLEKLLLSMTKEEREQLLALYEKES